MLSFFLKKKDNDCEKIVEIKVITDHVGRPKAQTPYDFNSIDLFMKPQAFDIIRAAKDCQTDKQVAILLGYTERYIKGLKAQKKPATVEVQKRIAMVMGSLESKWWIFYEFKPVVAKDQRSHNMSKFRGEEPYNLFSSAAQLRNLNDEPVEQR